MAEQLILRVSGEEYLRIVRSVGVPGRLRSLLARIDADMDRGIELDGAAIAAPDARQRCHYVLGELLPAIAADQVGFARNLLTYLSLHWPELRAIDVSEADDRWDVQLDLESV